MEITTFYFWSIVIGIGTILLWGIYVYFTIRTFIQIKKQTDLQIKAFLICKIIPKQITEEITLPDEFMTLNNKWHQILTNNLPDTVGSLKCLWLEITNRGKSDVSKWEIKVNILVTPGDYLSERNTIGEYKTYIIKSQLHQTIPPNGSIEIPMAFSGYFPSAKYSWVIEYFDIREPKKKNLSIENHYEDFNLLAYKYIQQ